MPRLLKLMSPLLLSLAATPCFAHAVLVDSMPAPNAHLPAGALAVKFRYNSRIDVSRSKLTLSGPGGGPARLAVHRGDTDAMLVADATVVPGAYTLRWQVLALDGHITRGSVPFSVDAP